MTDKKLNKAQERYIASISYITHCFIDQGANWKYMK